MTSTSIPRSAVWPDRHRTPRRVDPIPAGDLHVPADLPGVPVSAWGRHSAETHAETTALRAVAPAVLPSAAPPASMPPAPPASMPPAPPASMPPAPAAAITLPPEQAPPVKAAASWSARRRAALWVLAGILVGAVGAVGAVLIHLVAVNDTSAPRRAGLPQPIVLAPTSTPPPRTLLSRVAPVPPLPPDGGPVALTAAPLPVDVRAHLRTAR